MRKEERTRRSYFRLACWSSRWFWRLAFGGFALKPVNCCLSLFTNGNTSGLKHKAVNLVAPVALRVAAHSQYTEGILVAAG